MQRKKFAMAVPQHEGERRLTFVGAYELQEQPVLYRARQELCTSGLAPDDYYLTFLLPVCQSGYARPAMRDETRSAAGQRRI
jgi:hypothetical protein